MRDKIISLLASDVKPVKIAEMVACSEAYISEIRSSATYELELAEAKKLIVKTKIEEDIEEGYIKLETKLQDAIMENLPFAEFADLTRAMDTLIRRKQHAAPAGAIINNARTINNITLLSLPRAAAPEIVLSSSREMVAVNGKSLAPMPSSGVRRMFEDIEKKKHQIEDAEIIPEVATQPIRDKAKPHTLILDDE